MGINWKVLEPFEEVSSRQSLFGFRLSGATDYFDFYTRDEDALVYWLDNLNKFTINTDLREDYQLINEISRGLQATVYKAKEVLTGKKCVVKLVTKTQSSVDPAYLISIQQEIKLLRTLKHPNIVEFHKVYEDKKCVALVLSYVRGLDLSKFILKTGKLSEANAKTLMQGLLNTLVYLRSNGIMHNALASSNILLSSPEELSNFKLCDFGSATTELQDYNQDLVALASVLTTVLTGKFSMQSAASRSEDFSGPLKDFITKLSSRETFLDPHELLAHQWFCEDHKDVMPAQDERTRPTSQLRESLKLLKKSMRLEDLKVYLQLANIKISPEEISDWSDDEENEIFGEGIEEEAPANRPSVLSVSPNPH